MLRFLLFLVCSPALAVTLQQEAVVSEPFIRLGDIAATDSAELRELRIGHSPRAGATLVIKRADVQRVLGRLKPAAALRVDGAERVTVRRGPLETLELGLVRQSAERALRQAVSERFSRYEIQAAEESGRIAIPAGRLELKSRAPLQIASGSRITVWTDVLVDARHYQSIPVQFTLRAYQPALVARRALRAGEPLDAADLEVREVEAAGGAPLAADSDVAGMRLRRPLAAGAVLAAAHLEKISGVTRDQPVVVRIDIGGVVVETSALASRNARPGEVIRVRNAETNQTYPARVAGPGVVEALWR